MPNLPKSSWDPCAVCGDANGPFDSPRHMTPGRHDGETYLAGMKPEEKAIWEENGRGRICSTCRNRAKTRISRAKRVAKGLTARIKPARLWKGAE